MGRKPKPTAIKRLEGTYRRSRAPHEPTPIPGIPSPPSFLSSDAATEWRRIVPQLAERGLLERIDRAALVGYVTAWGELADAEACLRRDGSTVTTPRGAIVLNPQIKRAKAARDQLVRFAQEFGLTPSARTKVVSAKPKAQDADSPAARFFGRPA